MCSQYVDPSGLEALLASRLIALDKNPGVRPIGIGEVCRRLIGKAALGLALRNILHLCPSFGRLLINTYRFDNHLFIDGECIGSKEGTTQGDPLAMSMYAVASVPLIEELDDVATVYQLWYADDASALGSLNQLRK
uniref:Reverse transcriptase domain-containing protein n=1 Tax=Amphimedon queenslandica TaxID=400682 RepID=A0A1X7T2A3_AMPQE